ncbi:MAG: CPBP family intramembrane metalloprotease [Acidobacteria bacterium]|nr:CPBP family intramembrane metalloprotease [Acidobacteriota bacterium]
MQNLTRVLPERYRIKDDGKGQALTCVEAPTITVRVERGFAVTAAAARNYPQGSIFLDGAAQGGPFIDAQRAIYNLDHHDGCIRSFTLATCEQAMVVIRKALDLPSRDWTVFANDADLDTVLALWVLLNHLRLNDDPVTRAKVMPLLRLEGAIDAHGLELQDLVALPPDLLRTTTATLKLLVQEETELKSKERWGEINLLEYIADRLASIDALIYSPEDFEEVEELEELARVEIVDGSVAVVCKSSTGIYEARQQLRKLHRDRLGILILQKDPATYTLHQVDYRLPTTLEGVYQRLNLLDPAAGGSHSANRWGGSAEIGGSPRSTGTLLTAGQITDAVRQVFRKPRLHDVLSRIPLALWMSVVTIFPGLVVPLFLGLPPDRTYWPGETSLAFSSILTAWSGALFLLAARRSPGLYGWRRPVGLDWLIAFPVALIGSLAGGVWVPRWLDPQELAHSLSWTTVSTFLLLSVTAEMVFRGLVLGSVASRFSIQKSGGRWFLSWPSVISSVLYALCFLLPFLSSPGSQVSIPSKGPVMVLGGFLFGIAAGTTRERSESILPPILLHWICVALLLAGMRWL